MSVDSYGYDALNRLTGVSEVAASFISSSYQETSPYAQYYNYDRYGNRTLSFATTGATFITDTVWVEDALPAGATGYGDGGDGWTWISSDPAPVSGSMAHQSNTASGLHQHYFTGATSTMAVGSGDRLFAYVYLDPGNMPSEVMLQWNDGTSWEHRAYWGADNIGWGTNGTASRRLAAGPLPPSGGWMRLEAAASVVGLEGQTVSGMAFTLYDGGATWDRAGKSAQAGGAINNRPFNVDEARNRLLPMSVGVMEYDAVGNLSKDSYYDAVAGDEGSRRGKSDGERE
ncbi:MAG: hypothetical protein KIT57_04855 [Blastocatellales bacterium]|nr:hypothetical protein [Blastocatellales bacterium]